MDSSSQSWERLVVRTGSFWKNDIMVQSLGLTHETFGFGWNYYRTTRQGNEFTHWIQPADALALSRRIQDELDQNGQLESQLKELFTRATDELRRISELIIQSDLRSYTSVALARLVGQFCHAYARLYPAFQLTISVSTLERALTDWIKMAPLARSADDIQADLQSLVASDGASLHALPDRLRVYRSFLRRAAEIRLAIRRSFTESHTALDRMYQTVSERYPSVSIEALPWLTVRELEAVARSGHLPSSATLSQRRKAAVFTYTRGVVRLSSGSSAARIIRQMTTEELNQLPRALRGVGVVAGTATGRVVQAVPGQAIPSLSPHEILITPMLTPDLILTARRAAAIVTEEGGVTSHGAILARELARPCVIGVVHARAQLKPGMRITVHAVQGTIEIHPERVS